MGASWLRSSVWIGALALIGTAVTAVGVPAASGASAAGSSAPYSCAPGANGTIYGTFGDAGLIGWQADKDGVVACLGGSFYVRDGKNTTYGYGVYDNAKTTWTRVDGYLPALVTAFHRDGTAIRITNFGDRDVIDENPYVVVYSRVRVANPTGHAVTVSPEATSGLVALNHAPDKVPAHGVVEHDYAVAADRFGHSYAWPSDAALAEAGGFEEHFTHMRNFWRSRLRGIAQVKSLPDHSLVNAYKAGFVDTQIIRDGTHLNTGENGYDAEFSHDVIGILANLFTQGEFTDAKALLLRARRVVGTQRQYDDGEWTYPWLWAEYVLKTGNVSLAKANFATEGPKGADDPSIKDTAHRIAAQRTGPGGIMLKTNDIDANGYWTIDNYSALFGLAAYRYVAQRVGNHSEEKWATRQYNGLLAAVTKRLDATITRYHLHYLPCSMVEPNTDNRCSNAEDANWAAPFLFGRWAWDGYLFGARISGPGKSLIDATYNYGFRRLRGKLPKNTLGGYPSDFYSTGYNAGYGSWGLASKRHRDQGILDYEFMTHRSMSGPDSWWESADFPNTGSPWVGVHPASGQGSAPHAWGIANANKVLLDSLLAQRSDGQLLVGRGVPSKWLASGRPIAVSNFPTTNGHRLGATIRTRGKVVTLRLTGHRAAGPVLLQPPAFVRNIASVSAGTVHEVTGTVQLSSTVRTVRVTLRHRP